jgi:hypothetical protein
MEIIFQSVTRENFAAVLDTKVAPGQRRLRRAEPLFHRGSLRRTDLDPTGDL